ncbi:MAG: transporter substrate-binding domain-containing protein [Desulfobacterales bacterium]|nr:transporter substrate-binding domain-containing protein [Desulfobacterales bacterium]
MKKLFTCCLIALFLASGSAMAKTVVRIANETATPPFNFVDGQGNIKGFDVEIAAALCQVMGVEKKDVIQDWDGMIPGLLSKKFDAIISDMSITAKRLKVVNFSDSYYDETGLFLSEKGKTMEFSPQGLKGKRIGVQRATTWANYIKGVYGKTVEIKYYDAPAAQILDLASGRLDLVLASDVFVHKTLKSEDGKNLQAIGPLVTDKQYIGAGVGIAIRKEDKALLEAFNKALAEIKANGTYDEIYDTWFK